MIPRHSSRETPLDESFLNQKLQNAQAYDRIAGYFYHALSAKPRRSGRGCKDALDFFCS